ncbi:hypothetical protein BDK51DRAFT_16675, partial [Blyttiomyces helicus]
HYTVARVNLVKMTSKKFHILLDISNDVRRFGPPMLYATEHFESFNTTLRDVLVHSNQQAPSLNAARALALSQAMSALVSSSRFIHPVTGWQMTAGPCTCLKRSPL